MKFQHSESCRYNHNDAVLYALMEVVKDRYILISAAEMNLYDRYLSAARNNDENITIDLDTCENMPYKLVYGALMYHGIEKESVKKIVDEMKGYALINTDYEEFGVLTASRYIDIYIEDADDNQEKAMPFVALMQTKCEDVPYTSTTIFPCFDRYVWENMVNRPFLLACRKFMSIEGLTMENWKEYIEEDILLAAYQTADLYTGKL